MPQIKIHPPKQLLEHSLSQQELKDWQNELEIYLSQDDNMARFMADGRYSTWQSQEKNPNRITELHNRDPERPAEDVQNREDILANLLNKRRRQLHTFIGQIAKSASRNMYAGIVRHATSLEWVYNKVREDYDIQTKGIHFLNIVDLEYNKETKTPAGFYNEYCTVILKNIGKWNEVIHWNNNRELQADEVIGPLFEDVTLINVL